MCRYCAVISRRDFKCGYGPATLLQRVCVPAGADGGAGSEEPDAAAPSEPGVSTEASSSAAGRVRTRHKFNGSLPGNFVILICYLNSFHHAIASVLTAVSLSERAGEVGCSFVMRIECIIDCGGVAFRLHVHLDDEAHSKACGSKCGRPGEGRRFGYQEARRSHPIAENTFAKLVRGCPVCYLRLTLRPTVLQHLQVNREEGGEHRKDSAADNANKAFKKFAEAFKMPAEVVDNFHFLLSEKASTCSNIGGQTSLARCIDF